MKTEKTGAELTRLDALVRQMLDCSWNKARDRIRTGKISVGGEVILDIGQMISSDAKIVFDETARKPKAADLLLPADAILHVDRDIVVVDKPSGLLTVPWEKGDRPTLDGLLRSVLTWREKSAGRLHGPGKVELHVVHRLDRNTSGVLVFARTAPARDKLKDQFREHSASRRYVALVHGEVGRATTLESHIVLDRGDGLRGSKERAPSRFRARLGFGKSAVTHVEVLARLPGATVVACRLETGRTNQIRIHLSEAGHPLIGETTYLRDYLGKPIPAPRLMLHAAELGFVHPGTDKPVRFQSKMPPEMEALCTALKASGPPEETGLRFRWNRDRDRNR